MSPSSTGWVHLHAGTGKNGPYLATTFLTGKHHTYVTVVIIFKPPESGRHVRAAESKPLMKGRSMRRSFLAVGAMAMALLVPSVVNALAQSSRPPKKAARQVQIYDGTNGYIAFYAYNPGDPGGGILEHYEWAGQTKTYNLSSSKAWIIDVHAGVSAATGPYETTTYIPAGRTLVHLSVHGVDGGGNWYVTNP